MRRSGAKPMPSMGHSRPWLSPRTGPSGKASRVPRGRSSAILAGQRVMMSASAIRMQGGPMRRASVASAARKWSCRPPQKPTAMISGASMRDRHFRNRCCPALAPDAGSRRDRGARPGRDAVEIAPDRLRHRPMRQRIVRAAIGRRHHRRQRQRRRKIGCASIAAADQRDRQAAGKTRHSPCRCQKACGKGRIQTIPKPDIDREFKDQWHPPQRSSDQVGHIPCRDQIQRQPDQQDHQRPAFAGFQIHGSSPRRGRSGIVSSRSGEVDSSATGHWISSSMRRTYLIASAGSSAQLRAPAVDSCQPGISS